ncbi:hypothetical protein AC578_1196 [Pseudocercospora eumusae]|uniref:Uncharacterized protein n=1 Tax=Pseudocercospora eumusae TaxID=321146 RepID=A0A139H058_9PEZI|nr:hypothetical protein AC578_1196 [Pseudocercospora eumusae]
MNVKSGLVLILELVKLVLLLNFRLASEKRILCRARGRTQSHAIAEVRSNDLINRHAAGYDVTVLLMNGYCRYPRTAKTYPYSPTLNLMVQTAINTLKDVQRGLKLHNAFIHRTFGDDEVWFGVLYFLIALMDKWICLVTGRQVAGLINSSNPVLRLSICLSLAYSLISNVFLDSVAPPL